MAGGSGVVDAYAAGLAALAARTSDVKQVVGIEMDDGRIHSVSIRQDGSAATITARAFVLAAGGFAAARYLGWLPGVIHAFFVVTDYKNEQRFRELAKGH